jgi:hypothetical protein
LNEAKRLAEKKADEDRAKQRKAERAARKAPKPRETAITLESIDNPSAPPAVQASTAAKAGTGLDDEEEENKDPSAPDVYLDEAVRIVSDWAALSGRGQAASLPKAVLTP